MPQIWVANYTAFVRCALILHHHRQQQQQQQWQQLDLGCWPIPDRFRGPRQRWRAKLKSVRLTHRATWRRDFSGWTQSVANGATPPTLENWLQEFAPQQQHNDLDSSVQLTRRSLSLCRSHARWSRTHGTLSRDKQASLFAKQYYDNINTRC